MHNFGTEDGRDLIIPSSPILDINFIPSSQNFEFLVDVVYTRNQTSYVLSLDKFNDTRAIRDVGLCENRVPKWFIHDNRFW